MTSFLRPEFIVAAMRMVRRDLCFGETSSHEAPHLASTYFELVPVMVKQFLITEKHRKYSRYLSAGRCI